MITCGTKQELESSVVDYAEHIPTIIKQLFNNLFTFDIANSYHIAFLALNKIGRGQGLGMELMHFAEKKCRESPLDTLSLYAFQLSNKCN